MKKYYDRFKEIDAHTRMLCDILVRGNQLKLEPDQRIMVAQDLVALQEEREELVKKAMTTAYGAKG